jgi:hypothetical protein
MKDLAILLGSPAFVPLSIGVGCCHQENVITVTNTAEDIEKSLIDLLEKVRNLMPFFKI